MVVNTSPVLKQVEIKRIWRKLSKPLIPKLSAPSAAKPSTLPTRGELSTILSHHWQGRKVTLLDHRIIDRITYAAFNSFAKEKSGEKTIKKARRLARPGFNKLSALTEYERVKFGKISRRQTFPFHAPNILKNPHSVKLFFKSWQTFSYFLLTMRIFFSKINLRLDEGNCKSISVNLSLIVSGKKLAFAVSFIQPIL